MKIKSSFALILGLLCLNAEAATQITLNGDTPDPITDPEDVITGGQGYIFDEDNATFTLDVKRTYFQARVESGLGNFTLAFSPPTNQALTNGYYPDAQRHSPPSIAPGILIGEDTRGCNAVTGEFVIHEYVTTDPEFPQIAIDFQQTCAGAGAGLSGKIRINSDIATTFAPPIAYAGRDEVIKEGEGVILNGSRSFVGEGKSIVSFLWSQAQPDPSLDSNFNALEGVGTTTHTLDLNSTLATIGQQNLGGAELVFELEVEDSNGDTSTDQVSVFVKSKSDPLTRINIITNQPDGSPVDYIADGEDGDGSWVFSPANAIITASKNENNGIQVEIKGDSYWVINFAAPFNNELTIKTDTGEDHIYEQANKFPLNNAQFPGLDVATNNRECTNVSGSFQIHQLEWNEKEIVRLHADFIQYCNGNAASLEGTIHINSQDESVPIINTASEVVAFEGETVTLDASQTFDSSSAIEIYKWTQISGTTVDLNGVEFATADFQAHTLPDQLRREFLTFNLFVEDSEGFRAQQDVVVRLEESNTPPTLGNDEGSLISLEPITINVRENDSDSDGTIQMDSFRVVNQPPFGTVKYNITGNITYTPNEDLNDDDQEKLKKMFERAETNKTRPQDRFSYIYKDNDGHSSSVGWVIIYYDKVTLIEDDTEEEEDSIQEPEFGAGANGLLIILLTLLSPLVRRQRR